MLISSERRAREITAKPSFPAAKPKQPVISPTSPGRPMYPAAQPMMTHACSSPGWRVQNLINYSFIGAAADFKPVAIRSHRQPDPCSHPSPWALKLMLPHAQVCHVARLSMLSYPMDPTCHPNRHSPPWGRGRIAYYPALKFLETTWLSYCEPPHPLPIPLWAAHHSAQPSSFGQTPGPRHHCGWHGNHGAAGHPILKSLCKRQAHACNGAARVVTCGEMVATSFFSAATFSAAFTTAPQRKRGGWRRGNGRGWIGVVTPQTVIQSPTGLYQAPKEFTKPRQTRQASARLYKAATNYPPTSSRARAC